jgi:hypothetical protein
MFVLFVCLFSAAQTEKNPWKKLVKTFDEFVTRLTSMRCCAMLATTATKFIQIELVGNYVTATLREVPLLDDHCHQTWLLDSSY